MKKVVRYAVTCIDNGDSCDGRPRFLGLFKTIEEAKRYVANDILSYEENGIPVDYDEMEAANCLWNIEKVEVELD